MDRPCMLCDFSRVIYRFFDFSRKAVGVGLLEAENVAKVLQRESLANTRSVI